MKSTNKQFPVHYRALEAGVNPEGIIEVPGYGKMRYARAQEVQARLMPGPDQPIHLCLRVLLDGEVIETRIPMEVIKKVVEEAHKNAQAL